METLQVSTSTMTAIGFTFSLSVMLPLILFAIVKIKTHANTSMFFIGCVTFLFFAMILEQVVHVVALSMLGPVSNFILNHFAVYALYGGLMAAVFEEVGRLCAMKVFMEGVSAKGTSSTPGKARTKLRKENALLYGVGHGGLESILIVGLTSFSNLVAATMLNSGTFAAALTGDDLTEMYTTLEPLATTPSWQFAMAGVERIFTICLQIALSILVYMAVKYKDKKYYFAIAVGIHFAVDFAATLANGLGANLLVVEGLVFVITAAACIFAFKTYQKEESEEPEPVVKKGKVTGIAAKASLSTRQLERPGENQKTEE